MKIAVIAEALSSDPRVAARMARESGFAGLLYNAYASALSIPELSQTGRREFRQVITAQDVQLVGLRGDVGPKGFGPGADIDRLIDRLDKAMEAASGLLAPLLCIEVGPLAEPAQVDVPKPAITQDQLGLLILPAAALTPAVAPAPARPVDTALQSSIHAAMAEIAIRADRYNVTVAFSSALSSFAALEAAVLSTKCPWFGIDLDPVAMLGDAWEVDDLFSRVGPLIRHVRARDALLGSGRRTKPTPIGQGSVDWASLLARLDQTGFNGWLSIDPTELTDRIEAASAGLALLGKHLSSK